MADCKYDCVVVGAGISGVSFAHYLAQEGKNVLLIEKDKTVGGEIQSALLKSDESYWRDLGAHTCYNSYTHLLDIVKDLDIKDALQPLNKGSYVLYNKEKIKTVTSELKFLPLIFNGIKLFFSSREGKDVEQYFGNIVGQNNYKHLFTYLFQAVLSQNADRYPAEYFLKRRGSRYEDLPRKYSFKKGLQYLLEQIVEKDRLNIMTNTLVSYVDYNQEFNEYEITTEEGKKIKANSLAIATPPNVSADLLEKLEPHLADLLSSIPICHSRATNVVIKKEKLDLPVVAGIIPLTNEFLSAVSRDLLEDDTYRSFTFHFKAQEYTEEDQMNVICKVLKISEKDVLEKVSTDHVLPSLRLSHLKMGEQVSTRMKRKNLYLLGNYFYGLSIEDCINRSCDEAQRFLKQDS